MSAERALPFARKYRNRGTEHPTIGTTFADQARAVIRILMVSEIEGESPERAGHAGIPETVVVVGDAPETELTGVDTELEIKTQLLNETAAVLIRVAVYRKIVSASRDTKKILVLKRKIGRKLRVVVADSQIRV